MAINSSIEWTTHTWNPWVGCTKVSDGCRNCYMYREQRHWGKEPTIVRRTSRQTWNQVKKFKPGDRVFVCSWSDFFHSDADCWCNDAWQVIKSRPDVNWLILTKRIERLHSDSELPKSVWLGVTVENEANTPRIEQLLNIQAAKRFVSIEPMLGPVDISDYFGPYIGAETCSYGAAHTKRECDCLFGGLDWVIVGCESGPKRRPCKLEGVKSLIDQCDVAGVPVFIKQLSINGKVSHNPNEWPEWARRREFL